MGYTFYIGVGVPGWRGKPRGSCICFSVVSSFSSQRSTIQYQVIPRRVVQYPTNELTYRQVASLQPSVKHVEPNVSSFSFDLGFGGGGTQVLTGYRLPNGHAERRR